MNMEKGLSLEKEFVVENQHSAAKVASGAVNVLSTPSVVAFIENTSFELAQKFMENGKTTVGFHIEVFHLAPVPLGEKVKVVSIIDDIKERKIKFVVTVYWKERKIAEGIHERVIVIEDEFYKKISKL
ncbi:thioesterase family protein [Sulfuracidifex metallicus]|jgi:predicted thioesterase|nr:thioesterase family protein [Sulfuracidifex metallicus]